MADVTYNLDKDLTTRIRPLAKLTRTLKGLKEKELQKLLRSVYDKVGQVESTAEELKNAKPVVDDATYNAKKKLIEDLIKSCNEANTEIDKARKQPVHASGDSGAPRNSIEVKDARKGVKTVGDLPDAGKKLDELSRQIASTKTQAEKDLRGFDNWFKKFTEDGSLEVAVPDSVTNMIESARKGIIAMPKTQSFKATLVFKDFPKVLESEVPLERLVATEFGKALEPLKQTTASNFQDWNDKFKLIQEMYDEKNAKNLFDGINDYFRQVLPGKIDKALNGAASDLLKSIRGSLKAPVHQKLLDNARVSTRVVTDYGGFANFVVRLPDDNPAEGFSKEFSESLKDAEKIEGLYSKSIETIKSSYSQIGKTARTMSGLVEDSEDDDRVKKAVRESRASVEKMNDAIKELTEAVTQAEANREKLRTALGAENKKLHDSKADLKNNVTVNHGELEKLQSELKELLRGLDRTPKSTLADLRNALPGVSEASRRFEQYMAKPDASEAAGVKNALKIGFDRRPVQLDQDLGVSTQFQEVLKHAGALMR